MYQTIFLWRFLEVIKWLLGKICFFSWCPGQIIKMYTLASGVMELMGSNCLKNCILFIQTFSSMADGFSMYHLHLHIAASDIWTNGFIQSWVVNTTQNITQQCCNDLVFISGHTAKVFNVRWCPLRESIICSGSDDG